MVEPSVKTGGEKVEDTQILDLYWERDEQAISESDKRYGRYCHSIAYNILHDREDSDECVNDTWMRAWNVIPPKRPDKLAIFLGTITRNLSIDRWKRKRARKRGNGEMDAALDELIECIPASSSVEDVVEASELEKMINDFLYDLPERDCNVFLRRYWFMEEYSAISRRYGMKLNTVKTSLHRTREKLKVYLEKEGVVL